MRRTIIFLILLFAYYFSLACQTPQNKLFPEYKGVDPELRPYLDEYRLLSAQNNIHFGDSITMGFKKIRCGAIIGLTSYSPWFREIDFDTEFWGNASGMTKKMLFFHEATHAYCYRGHDYGKGKEYPKLDSESIFKEIAWLIKPKQEGGFFADGCPMSIMHPVILDDQCSEKYYDYYIKEMFDRCEPYK